MNRRDLIKSAAILPALMRPPGLWAKHTQPEIAFTFDDPTTENAAGLPSQEINERMLAALARYRIKAVLFVVGKRVDTEAGRHVVATWDQAGHTIGNHSYSHLFFNNSKVTLTDFEADVLKNEPLIRDYPHFVRLFRFPYFKEGETAEKRDGMRSFLRQHGYRIGRATIDASDWAISDRLEKRVGVNPRVDTTPYGEFLKQHIWERAQFYDSLAHQVLGRPIRHTVLLHHNALNALFLDQLIEMFVEKGWKPIDASYAYADPVYDLQPKILPAGEGLIWALAKQSGEFDNELRYPGEDDIYENPKMDALGL
ncbi:MAG TPA: polysaccharide deacetylase family protein [Terriglobales bacterium]|nr:polysaccharide deacetylase family protein [Terriglobales bacterium]